MPKVGSKVFTCLRTLFTCAKMGGIVVSESLTMRTKYLLGGLVGAAAAVAICGTSATAGQGTATGGCQGKGILATGLAAVGGVVVAAFFAEQFGASRQQVSDAKAEDKSEVKPPEMVVETPPEQKAEREMVSLK